MTPTLLTGAHHFPIRVYYQDTDAGGVVYHANYLGFAERARTEALRALGVPHSELTALHGLIFMVRRVKLDYLAPARLDDALTVTSVPLAVRGASVDLRQTIMLGAIRLVDIEIQLACVQAATGRPGRIPPRWRDAFALMMGASNGDSPAD
jgi:acyl-CoA thioester hydrolase